MTAIETEKVLGKEAAPQAATTEIRVQQVLLDEAAALHDPKALAEARLSAAMTARQLNIGLNQLNSAALCLSGGGIRSAAFSLGVIQALASFPEPAPGQPADPSGTDRARGSFLAQFHYLSTVSGGGYIGSWLSTWLKRDNFSTVWQQLVKRPEAPDREPTPLSWLRRYSNYLTPKLGIVSADAWADIAIALRNMILNWLVLLPILCIALLLLKFAEITVIWLAQFPKTGQLALPFGIEAEVGTLFAAVGVLGALLLIAALCFATLNRPTRGNSVSTQTTFLRWDWIPALFAAFLLSLWPVSSWASTPLATVPLYVLALAGAGIGAVILAIAWLSAYMVSAFITRRGTWRKPAGDFLLWIVAGLVYGSLMACGAHLYFALSDPKSPLFLSASSLLFDVVKNPAILLLMLGVPWALSAQLIAEMAFVGLSSYEAHSDSDREWLGRSGGWFMAAAIGWLLVMFLVLIGSALLDGLAGQAKSWIASGGISGLVTALVGKSSLSPAKPGETKTLPAISMNVILAISGPVFAISLVIVTSALLDKVLLGASLLDMDFAAPRVELDGHFPDVPSQYGWLALGLGIAIAVEVIASLAVNINRFSLHSLYRNRLIRAFLGATNPTREKTRNPFTDFDTSDNPHMHELWPNKDNTKRLFHVVNIALNIVSTKDLAWQERKAESFIVSPLHAGNARLGFRPSAQYGHRDKGISVGTAVAISGAAASPNMGYHSSPSITFLLALFNVRLGWWLGNPGPNGEKTYPNEGPGVAVMPLLMEAFGLTTDDRSYVYLSDGGHFENLGLYEMVRRRCKFIVMVDAGCDRDFAYEDLGNAVRKIEIDQGVRIDFPDLHLLPCRPKDGTIIGLNKPYYTVGKIHYPAADEGGEPGKILYLKPAYHGVEGAGVQSYATAHPEFPHESTADQWFSESQFESYRSLAFEVTSDLLKAQIVRMAAPAKVTIADLFAAL